MRYTLGSLSNKPGRDWATPRYVRKEPAMNIAGYGQDEDNWTGSDEEEDPFTSSFVDEDKDNWTGDDEEGITPVTAEPGLWGKFWDSSSGKWLEKQGSALVEAGTKIATSYIVNAAGQAVDKNTGRVASNITATKSAVAQQGILPPLPASIEPIELDVEGLSPSFLAMVKAQYPTKFKTPITTWLILAGAGVGIYLFLRKR